MPWPPPLGFQGFQRVCTCFYLILTIVDAFSVILCHINPFVSRPLVMRTGRPSPFNDAQETIIKGYILAFEAKVNELDPALKGNNSQVTQWKAVTAEEILGKPEFQGLEAPITKWRVVSTLPGTRYIILTE
jgi:hypothetical protein